MTTGRFACLLAALSLSCLIAACTVPGEDGASQVSGESSLSSAGEEAVSVLPQEELSQSQEGEEAVNPLYVADAACYRGTVAAIDTALSGETIYRLEAFPGSGLDQQLLVTFDGARADFDLSEIALGDHLEVFYQPPQEEGCGLTCYEVIAANRLMPAEAVYYNGILTGIEEGEDGETDLVMVPEGTSEDQWEDPMIQFVFHVGEGTQFYCASDALAPGSLLNIYHRGVMTMSIPPQGAALEVRLMSGE